MTTVSVTKNIAYTYNNNGSLAITTYPSGVVIGMGYDYIGRPTSMITNTQNIVTSVSYAPHGALSGDTLGYVSTGFQGYANTYTYNKRLQPVNMKTTHTSGTVTIMDQTYSFTPTGSTINNGTVMSVTNNLATNRSQSYIYDEINRLATAQSAATTGSTDCWAQVYTYDRYANLSSIQWPSSGWSGCTASMPTMSLSINQSNNRVTTSGHTYDNAGNVTADGTYSYTWNAEGRMATTAGVTYTYDGDGKRVKKSNGTLYWYGLGGEVLAESDLSGNTTFEYIYFNGQRIARRDPSSGTVQYYLADRLGSARLLADSTGTVLNESDYYPYGGERVVTTTSGVTNNYKFTGHERDSESGLDHTENRQYTSAVGRWLSPDSLKGKSSSPQSWNLYAYVLGDPIGNFDPLGQACSNVTSSGGVFRITCDNSPPNYNYPSSGTLGYPIKIHRDADDDPQEPDNPEMSPTVQTNRFACAAEYGEQHSLAAALDVDHTLLGNLFLGNTVSAVTNLGLFVLGDKAPTVEDLAGIALSGGTQGLGGSAPGSRGPADIAQEEGIKAGVSSLINYFTGARTNPTVLGITSSGTKLTTAAISEEAVESIAGTVADGVGLAKLSFDLATWTVGLVKGCPNYTAHPGN